MALPTSSRAAVLRKFGDPLRIEDVRMPKEVEPGAILVRTEACSICGTDVHLWQGSLALKVDLPVIIGHEMVGRVVALGSGSDRDSIGQDVKVGDRVLWTHTACGSCYYCTVARQETLCENKRMYMYETIEKHPYVMGGFSEYGYVLPDSGRIKVPESVDNAMASLSSCAFRSVMNGMNNLGEIRAHEYVVIQGAGPLGLLATAVATVAGAKKVIVVGAPDARLELAKEFGATHTISIEKHKPEERLGQIREMTDGRGADIVMEFTGYAPALNEGIDIARKGARYLIVGQLGEGAVPVKPSMIVKKNLNVIGSFSGDARSYWQALQFMERHQDHIPFQKMITGRYKLDDVNMALTRMKAMEEIKPVLELV